MVAAFLHSQPTGQKATLPELYRLVGQNHADRIQLGKALTAWSRTSWFLDEKRIEDLGPDGVPVTWRLGAAPNLRQIHDQCRGKVRSEVEPRLIEEVKKARGLYDVPPGPGVHAHKLPASPGDVEGTVTAFHYVVLGPTGASNPDRPSPEAVRYLLETTGPDRPRSNKNHVLVAVPSTAGLDSARDAVLTHLAWERVAVELADQELDALRAAKLKAEREGSLKAIAERVRQAWCIGVTLNANAKPAAHQVTPEGKSLFAVFQGDARLRIHSDPINADALLPGCPYDVWTRGSHTERYLGKL